VADTHWRVVSALPWGSARKRGFHIYDSFLSSERARVSRISRVGREESLSLGPPVNDPWGQGHSVSGAQHHATMVSFAVFVIARVVLRERVRTSTIIARAGKSRFCALKTREYVIPTPKC
jgi:hypothetical protein